MTDLDALLDRLADLVADRVAARLNNGNGNGHAPVVEDDKLLTAGAVAARLGVHTRWVYGHDLPFAVRLPGRAVRYSAVGLARYIEKRGRK